MAGMFFEIPTIWKKKRCPPQSCNVFEAPKTAPTLNRIRTNITTRFSKTSSLAIWKPRRIGVFFAQRSADNEANGTGEGRHRQNVAATESSRICLVLIEPSQVNDDEHLLFCYRKVHNEDSLHKPRPNANTMSGRRRYTIEEDNLQELIRYITKDLLPNYLVKSEMPKHKRCAEIATHLGKDILWGWEEFATQVVQFSSVRSQKDLKRI